MIIQTYMTYTQKIGLDGSVSLFSFSPRFDHEIFSTVILSLLLIQEGQLSDSGKKICTILVNHLED